MDLKVFVVADPGEAAEIAAALAASGLGNVGIGGGDDDTLDELAERPVDVLVLRDRLAAGDPGAFAAAVRDTVTPMPAVVLLVSDDDLPTDVAADRVLHWPNARVAIGAAVRAARSRPAAPAPFGTASNEASWRQSTQIVASSAPAARTQSGSDAGSGTFVRELRQEMADIEARLFGAEPRPMTEPAQKPPDADLPDLDLDAIGLETYARVTPMAPAYREPTEDDSGNTALRVPAPSVGDLATEDVPALLVRLHRQRFTGQVAFRRDDVEKTLVFDEGAAIFASSNVTAERMGELLVREGKITREQEGRARQLVDQTGRRMGEVLVDMGFLKRRELLPAVRRHVEDVTYSIFEWDGGQFTVLPGSQPSREKILLASDPVTLVVEGIRRKMDVTRLETRLGGARVVLVPTPVEDASFSLDEVDLAPDERATVALFDGRRTLADVVTASRMDRATVLQLAYALSVLGVLRPVASRDSSHTAPGALAGPVDVEIDRERVLAKYAHVVEADYFTLLGVRRNATAFEIRRAYEAARRDFAAEVLPHEIQRELQGELRAIAQVLDEAFHVLRDDEVRSAYLTNLVG